jgi:hypothetical protein
MTLAAKVIWILLAMLVALAVLGVLSVALIQPGS